MTAERVSRRGLLGLLRKTDAQPAFSLSGFYGAREVAPTDDLPVFSLRCGLPDVETSSVGQTRAPAAPLPWAVQSATPIDGVVRVRTYACLAHRGSPCSVCSERCREEGAIVVDAGKPTVNPERCTGCGACVAACPAPVNGFDVVPRGA